MQAQASNPVSKQKKSFKETYTQQRRKQIAKQAAQKNPGSMVVVIQKHDKFQGILPDLLHSRFIVQKNQKVIDILKAVRDRLVIIDTRCNAEAVILYANTHILSKESSVVDVYEKYRDQKDGILYLKYTNMDSF